MARISSVVHAAAVERSCWREWDLVLSFVVLTAGALGAVADPCARASLPIRSCWASLSRATSPSPAWRLTFWSRWRVLGARSSVAVTPCHLASGRTFVSGALAPCGDWRPWAFTAKPAATGV